jgi:hypothetical protein
MTLIRNAVDGLRARVHNLTDDFAFWQGRTAQDGDLPQHQSQVKRITDMLKGSLEEAVSGSPVTQTDFQDNSDDLARLPALRRDIGSVHLVWEFFRDKFAQRDVASLENHLGCGDDLAWACYKSCLEAALDAGAIDGAAVKEPPLVFYSASTYRAPFAQSRSDMFHPQGLDSKDIGTFSKVLIHLPVPVIGLPWAIANRLPELVLVGHETGHVVAEDLGLAEEAEGALRDLTLDRDPNERRKQAWLSWCDEVFADLFGVVATGSAFVAALGAELAAGIQETRASPIDLQRPGKYPTPTLRMALCEEALTRLGVTPSEAWRDQYGSLSGPSREFRDDIAPVVESLLLRQWDQMSGRALPDVLPWSDTHETQSQHVAHAMLNKQPVAGIPFDVRVWIAGAQVAVDRDGATYAALGLDGEMARFIVERRSDSVRFKSTARLEGAVSFGLTDEESEKVREKRDFEAGRKLFTLLTSLQ